MPRLILPHFRALTHRQVLWVMHRKEGLAVTSVIGVVERRQTMSVLANVLGQQKLAVMAMNWHRSGFCTEKSLPDAPNRITDESDRLDYVEYHVSPR